MQEAKHFENDEGLREKFRVRLVSDHDFVHIPLDRMKQHARVIIALRYDANSPAGCE